MRHGIDVSEYQVPREIDLAAAHAAGHADFILIRATYGRMGIDSRGLRHAQEASACGIPLGYYGFAKPDSSQGDARAEALHLLHTIRGWPRPTWLALDLEAGDKALPPSDLAAWVDTWLGVVGGDGVSPWLYTTLDFLRHHLAPGAWRRAPLWLAVRKPIEIVTPAWVARKVEGLTDAPVACVQWTSSGRIAGYEEKIDRDVML